MLQGMEGYVGSVESANAEAYYTLLFHTHGHVEAPMTQARLTPV